MCDIPANQMASEGRVAPLPSPLLLLLFPSSPPRLSSGQSIQMVSALILQLVQCIVIPPKPEEEGEGSNGGSFLPSRPDTPSGSENGEDKDSNKVHRSTKGLVHTSESRVYHKKFFPHSGRVK